MENPQHPLGESDFNRMIDAVFVRSDEELMAKLRAQVEAEQSMESLSKATGIEDQDLLQSLHDQGIRADSLTAMTLYPLVCVAYADGILNIEERDLIMEMAHEWTMEPGDHSYQLLNEWLVKGPTQDGFAVWKQYMQHVTGKMRPEQKQQFRENIVARCHRVAQAVGDVLGRFGVRETMKEKDEVARIEAALR